MMGLLTEILTSISSHKLRASITGFSVAWAIFQLIFLLGAGDGIAKGVQLTMGLDTLCLYQIEQGMTQIPYEGYEAKRRIQLKMDDLTALKSSLGDEVSGIEASCNGPIMEISHKNKHLPIQLEGMTPGFLATQNYFVYKGDALSYINYQRKERVCLLTKETAQTLFGSEENILGKSIEIGNNSFRVVGFYKSPRFENLPRIIFIPITTAQDLFNHEGNISKTYVISRRAILDDNESAAFAQSVVNILSLRHHCSPADHAAISCHNNSQQSLLIQDSFSKMKLMVWIISLTALMIGICGISNIMLISVKDRTSEFGIRKAMGASNTSILTMVLGESVTVALIFGYLGMIIAIGILQLGSWLTANILHSSIFINPSVGLNYIGYTFLVLITTGIVAGIFPAVKAFRMKLIDALNS